jgi:hypothetical protein
MKNPRLISITAAALVSLAIVAAVGLFRQTAHHATQPQDPVAGLRAKPPSDHSLRDTPSTLHPVGQTPADTAPAPHADDTRSASSGRPNLPDLADFNLLDTEDLAKLLEAYGSFEELYRAADGDQRLALAMYLAHEDAMRDYIGPLLAIEADSDMRAFLLMRTLPEGYFDEPDPENPFPRDDDLMRILDSPMETPIELDEWMARMELALDLDYEYALRWVRDGQRLFPDNPEMQLLASTMLVNLGASLGTLSDTEVRAAEQSLYNSLSGPGAEQFTPGQRMRGYWALVFAQDRARTREFFNQRRAQETSPQVRDLLDNLLRQLDLLDIVQTPP